MNDEQIMSLGVCVGSFGIYCSMLAKAFGMHAENQLSEVRGDHPAYLDSDFDALISTCQEGVEAVNKTLEAEDAKDK